MMISYRSTPQRPKEGFPCEGDSRRQLFRESEFELDEDELNLFRRLRAQNSVNRANLKSPLRKSIYLDFYGLLR